MAESIDASVEDFSYETLKAAAEQLAAEGTFDHSPWEGLGALLTEWVYDVQTDFPLADLGDVIRSSLQQRAQQGGWSDEELFRLSDGADMAARIIWTLTHPEGYVPNRDNPAPADQPGIAGPAADPAQD